MEFQPSTDHEAGMLRSHGKRGGWITFPFIAATLTGVVLSGWGWTANLIVYLIEVFHVKSIAATQIANIVNGSFNLLPIAAAILADSYFGCFSVIAVFTGLSFLGIVLLTLTASVTSLRPPPCETGSTSCQFPSSLQFAMLYAAIVLASIGFGAMRFILATMGANQFSTPKSQGVFFNWFFFIVYAASMVSTIGIVYVENSVSWGLGFGLSAAANFFALAVFLLGSRFYIHDKPQGSPYTGLARVVVSAVRKRNIPLSSQLEDYHHEKDGTDMALTSTTFQSLRFLNRASIKTEGDIHSNGTIAKPWSLCTVQEVENFKALLRILPLWSTNVFLSVPIAIQANMLVLQALAMDRHVGPAFKIPAGSVIVVFIISTCICLAVLDRFLIPAYNHLTRRTLTPLQRIGIGHVFNVLSMVISALVESRRLKLAHTNRLMMVSWLFPQLIMVGLGEALHFPGQVSLYYQEFPVSLRSTATAMIAVVIAIAYYVSSAVVDLIQKVTSWLPDDINEGRLDNVFWTLVVLGAINFGYYLICCVLYRYGNVDKEEVRDSGGDTASGET